MGTVGPMDRQLRNTIVYGVIVSWTLFPFVCVLIVTAICAIYGCTVNEGSPTPCIVFGVDIGRPLYILSVMGWLGCRNVAYGSPRPRSLHGICDGGVAYRTPKETIAAANGRK
jgi:hypothetical protein